MKTMMYVVAVSFLMSTFGCGRSTKVNPDAVTAEQEQEMATARAEVDQSEAAQVVKGKGKKSGSGYVNPEEAAAKRR